jgi:TolA-binding protein
MESVMTRAWFAAASVILALASPSIVAAGQAAVLLDARGDRAAVLLEEQTRTREQTEPERAERERERAERERERAEQSRDRFDNLYEQGQEAIERAQWPQAVERFTALVSAKAPRADAALYWRAYSLDKLNRQAEALTSVADLLKTYPSSRWDS